MSRFVNEQTTLFIDRLIEGDLLQTPSLVTMFEKLKSAFEKFFTAATLINVAKALSDCCEELYRKLDNLTQLINKRFRLLKDLLLRNLTSIREFLSDQFEKTNNNVFDSQFMITSNRFNEVDLSIEQTNCSKQGY